MATNDKRLIVLPHCFKFIPNTSGGFSDCELYPSNNAQLGVFVAVRIKMSDLGANEAIIRDRIRLFHPEIPATGGALHIGYAHILSESVRVNLNPNETALEPAGTVIAFSGRTGGPNLDGLYAPGNENLDITVFYLYDENFIPRKAFAITGRERTQQSFPGYEQDNSNEHYNGFYGMYVTESFYGRAIALDPLVLWPSLIAPVDGQYICR